jgi:hypothetical protein
MGSSPFVVQHAAINAQPSMTANVSEFIEYTIHSVTGFNLSITVGGHDGIGKVHEVFVKTVLLVYELTTDASFGFQTRKHFVFHFVTLFLFV